MTLFIEGLRIILIGLGALVGYEIGHFQFKGNLASDVGLIVGTMIGYVAGGVIGRTIARAAGMASRKLANLSAVELLAATIMGTAGLVVAAILAVPILLLVKPVISSFVVAALVWVLTYIGIRIGFDKGNQVLKSLGLARRLAPGSGPLDQKAILVDLSAAMERTLWVLGLSRVLPDELVVPVFVIDELRSLVESTDPVDSRRARRALEFLDALREDGGSLLIAEEEVPEVDSVEGKAVKLAERLGTRLATCSSRVIQQASERGIAVLDLRRLSLDLSPDYLAGQCFEIDLIKGGNKPGQAVGYTKEGDMVVVSDASHLVGRGPVMVEVMSSRRTPQGVLIFARLVTE